MDTIYSNLINLYPHFLAGLRLFSEEEARITIYAFTNPQILFQYLHDISNLKPRENT